MSTPNACVLIAPGINCNQETAFALETAGASAEQVHISQLQSGERRLDDYGILALSGGFSYGDDIASGRILGLELRKTLGEDLNRFVEAGKAVVGICNGFQVLVETGLLPAGRVLEDGEDKTATLAHNSVGHFVCRWARVAVNESRSLYATPNVLGRVIELPSAHGEGRFVMRTPDDALALIEAGQVVMRFDEDEPGSGESNNLNGSDFGITGICDPNGVVLGMMPHPERFVLSYQHPNYHRNRDIQPQGLPLFKAIVDYTRTS